MVRSSCGRFSCIRFIKSRNLVSVRAVVAICWRKLAMRDYTREEGGTPGRDKTGRVVDYSLRGRTSPLGRAQALTLNPRARISDVSNPSNSPQVWLMERQAGTVKSCQP